MKTTMRFIAIILFATILGACESDEKVEERNEPSPTESAKEDVAALSEADLQLKTITNGNINSFAAITGRVIPTNTTQLFAEVQGRIQSGTKAFKAGTQFKRGQTILSIDNKEFALNLEAQKIGFLNLLVRMMPDIKADYPDNYENWKNYIASYEGGVAVPKPPATLTNAEKYFVTSQQVYNTYYTIKAQEERLKKYTLIAPYNGSVSAALVDMGGLVSPGQPLGTFISDGQYEIETGVNLSLANSLKLGQTVEFYSKDLQQNFEAEIVRINNILDLQTQNVPVFFKINSPELKSGLYLEGRLELNQYADVVNIPKSSLGRDNSVHILESGVIVRKEVEVIASDRDTLTVRGLSNGTRLILNTFDKPVAGLKIAA